MSASVVQSLNKQRNLSRCGILICAGIELAAVAIMFAVSKPLGLAIGLIAFISYFVFSRIAKKRFSQRCARSQALSSLGLTDPHYLGRQEITAEDLLKTGLLPDFGPLDKPLCQHALTGAFAGVDLQLCEITFGYPEGKKHVFTSGVFAQFALANAVEEPMVFAGAMPFKRALVCSSYAHAGLKLTAAGGKKAGWHAWTASGSMPPEALCARFAALAAAADGRAVLSLKGDRAYAFFYGHFYTGVYPLGEEITAAQLLTPLFPALLQLTELAKA